MLLLRGCLVNLIKKKEFYLSLLDYVQEESKHCKDVQRLSAILSVSTGLIVSTNTSQEALALVCRFLGHEFPRVRSLAAEKLYVRLLDTEPELGEDHTAIRLLLEYDWGSNGNFEESIRKESIIMVTKAFELGDQVFPQ